MTTEYTDHFRLSLPDFRTGPWHDLVNDDFVMVDELLWNLYNDIDTTYWTNNTLYTVGTTAIDTDGSFWICMVQHTSAAAGTFAADRAAHPTYWNRVIAGIAPRGEWANSTHYLPGDLVCDSSEHVIALCKTEHVSNASGSIRDDAAKWTYLVDMSVVVNANEIAYDNSSSGSLETELQGTTDDLYLKHSDQQTTLDGHTVTIAGQSSQITALNAQVSTNSGRLSSIEGQLSSFVAEAPNDGQIYGRKSLGWEVIVGGTVGEAPIDGEQYARKDGGWEIVEAPATPPGGSNGQVQYNNSGVFGGLSDAQLTARIGIFTGSLSGATPASPGGTTFFLRADGSWAVPPGGTGGSGDVVGPASAVNLNIAVFDGTTGKLIKDGGAKVADFASVSHTHTFASITSKPTTLSGYGITDAQSLDATLTALAALNSTAGLLEQTGADAFTKRLIGVANATDIPTRGDADTRYQASLGYTPVNKAGDTMTGNLVIAPASGVSQLMFSPVAGQQGTEVFQDGGTSKWQVGKHSNNHYIIYDVQNAGLVLDIDQTGGHWIAGGQTNNWDMTLYAKTFNFDNATNNPTTFNFGGISGGGVTFNFGSAGDGLSAFNVYNNVGAKQEWVPGGGNTVISFPTLTGALMGTAGNQTTTGGFRITPYNGGTVSSGTYTPDAYNHNYQYYTNNGAHTLAAPANDSAIDILITNGSTAGAITFSGYTVGSNVGDTLTTTNTSKFIISIRRINSVATYTIKALQ